MLVIHPQDKSTTFLSELYTGRTDVTLFDGINDINLDQALTEAQNDQELTMFLGHGLSHGLLNVTSRYEYGSFLINSRHVRYLASREKLFGMWCYANEFARQNKLKGLWSGMIISELAEARYMGVPSTQKEITEENWKLSRNVRYCLDNYPLAEIPAILKTMDDRKSPLTNFNYNSWFFYA